MVIRKKAIILVVLAAAVVAAAVAAFGFLGHKSTGLTASGTLEARNISVGSKVGGRISDVLVREGDHVQPGQLLVRFEDRELEADVLQARGHLEQAKAALEKALRGARPEEIEQSKADSAARTNQVAQAQAQMEQARANFINAEREFNRIRELADSGVASKAQRDDAEAAYNMAKANLSAAEHAIHAAQGQAQAARAVEQKTVRGNRVEDIAMARADVVAAEGALKLAEARYAEREVKSPATAYVEVLDIRPGDLLQPNAPIAKLLEADQLYVIVYVPQTEIGKVRVGQKAQIRVDTYGNRPFDAVVEQIRQQAEFLPRNVQTKEEREHQVIGVRLRVENPKGELRAGVNADVTFLAEAQ
jgi:multidrug resistance efflux pump